MNTTSAKRGTTSDDIEGCVYPLGVNRFGSFDWWRSEPLPAGLAKRSPWPRPDLITPSLNVSTSPQPPATHQCGPGELVSPYKLMAPLFRHPEERRHVRNAQVPELEGGEDLGGLGHAASLRVASS